MRKETPGVRKLLDFMEDYPVRWGLNVEQKHLYCDMCSEVIYPNTPAHMYLIDRAIKGPDELRHVNAKAREPHFSDFWWARVSHKECEPVLPYPCKGYTELVLLAEWGSDFRLSRPELVEISSRNKGLPWNPEKAWNVFHEALPAAPTMEQYLNEHPMFLGPHDVICKFLAHGVDPRWVIDMETGEYIGNENLKKIRETWLEETSSLVDQWKKSGQPPPGFRFPRHDPDKLRKKPDDFDFKEGKPMSEELENDEE